MSTRLLLALSVLLLLVVLITAMLTARLLPFPLCTLVSFVFGTGEGVLTMAYLWRMVDRK